MAEVSTGLEPRGGGGWVTRLVGSPLTWTLVVIALLLATWAVLDRELQARHRALLVQQLEKVHLAARRSLANWGDFELATVRQIASDPDVVRTALAAVEGDEYAVVSFSEHLSTSLATRPMVAFELVTVDGTRIVTHDGSALGTPTALLEQGDIIERLLDGEEAIGRPLRSDMLLPDQYGRFGSGQPALYSGAPVFDERGDVAALLLVVSNPSVVLDERLVVGRFGASGETFLIDAEGFLLSATRFDDVLVDLGYLQSDADAPPLRVVEAPEAEGASLDGQPVTRAVAGSISGRPGIDTAGYRNLRQRTAVGTWSWLPAANAGLVTELEHAEAYARLNGTRRIIGALFVAASALAAALGLAVHRRHQASQRHAEELRQTAYFDALTQLPNRRLFRIELEQALDLAHRHGHLMALMFLDLDDFKRVNDSLGHDAGDELLQHVATRLESLLRKSDVLARPNAEQAVVDAAGARIARLGGDEFTVILSRIRQPADAHIVAQRVIDSLAETIQINGAPVVVSPSIGVAVGPDDGAEADTLTKNADTAMYVAKQAGKNRYAFFSSSMSEQAQARLAMESRLRETLERDGIDVHYQPKVDARSGALRSVEALARWQDGPDGPVSPAEFIEVAESSGMVGRLGASVLRVACADAAAWRKAALADVNVAVNVAALQFAEDDFVDIVSAALRDSGLPAEALKLELTEGIVLDDAQETVDRLQAIRALGVQVSIDDFGTGYSSFAYLTRFPINELKIDKSLIDGVPDQRENAAIVRAIVAMAASLGMEVVAEGVEHASQADWLRAAGVDSLQGWLYSPALPADELLAWAHDAGSAQAPGAGA